MYRLSRFFISDIVAGENILRNGYFPIFKEEEKADHGIVVAANGSCKTTLLSFLFSAFSPERRRFVQYLQSSGDKTLEQYLVPGRPALVLLNLTISKEPELFNLHPKEHLVLGQVLNRHKNTPDKIDRLYFVADTNTYPGFFDSLRMDWDELSSDNHPYTAVKEYIEGKVYKTSQQKEWEEKLESLGLDPWLVNRQVDFSRSEGGIKDAFKFKSEGEFLSFFLGCVGDIDSAVALRKSTSQTLEKMKSRPEKKKQMDAVLSLKNTMAEYHDLSADWRNAKKEIEHFRFQLGEAAHLLGAAETEAEEALRESEASVRQNLAMQKETHGGMETAKANQLKVEEAMHARRTEELKELIRESENKIKDSENEQRALKAAEFIASLRKSRAEAESMEKILGSKDSQLEPARKQIELRAAQYHARLGSRRLETRESITTLETEKKGSREKLEATEKEIGDLRKELLALNAELSRLKAQIRAARTARENLELPLGELPEQAGERISAEILSCRETLSEIASRMEELENKRVELEQEWQFLQKSRIECEGSLGQARNMVNQELDQRKELLSDKNLKTVAGSADFEPTRADLTTRLEETVSRIRTGLSEIQLSHLETESELKRLEEMDTMTVDSQVVSLISHYTEQGVSPGDLRPFPEYLSGLYDDPREIAEILERDPGRFTGIMAKSDDIIEKARKIPVPGWLHKPVIISTPHEMDKAGGTSHPVITPSDPMVYSRTYLEERKKTLAGKKKDLEARISERMAKLASCEESGRKLAEYRKRYPDKLSVEALARNVQVTEEKLENIKAGIREKEEERVRLASLKKDLEARFQKETSTRARLDQVLKQVSNWLSQYGEYLSWEENLEAGDLKKQELSHGVNIAQEEERKIRDGLSVINETLAEKKAELKNLDDRAEDVPVSEAFTLTDEQKQQALSMDLQSLRKQHEEAQSNQIRIASDLGIDTLRKDLEQVRAFHQRTAGALERFQRGNSFNESTAEKWAGESSRDRDERTSDLSAVLEIHKEKRGRYEGQLEGRIRDRGRCGQELKQLSSRGIHTDIDPGEMERTDPEGLIEHYRNIAESQEEKLRDLKRDSAGHNQAVERNRKWAGEIKLAAATLGGHGKCWDSLSPRGEWPELIRSENPSENAVLFRKRIEEILKSRGNTESLVETSRKSMGRAFDRLQGKLRDEDLKKQLPAIVDELSRHDAETLGQQSQDLMEKCGHIATNIESDLSRSKEFVENLVSQLFKHVRESHRKIQKASRQLMPGNVFVYGGQAILKAGTRLDFSRHGEIYRKSIDNWLDELIQEARIPEVNSKAGDTLGTELLYRLLRTSSAKQEFGIRLLKCDDTGRNYEPVGKDLGSGGEALTTAVLLYSLLTSMRQKRRNQKEDKIPAFLIADNPLGVCNRSDFLDAQLKVARAMGIQCVYFTGINDRESLGLFQHRVAIRQSGHHLKVAGKSYKRLEIIEQNVEDKD